MEIAVTAFLILWISLYYLENSARKKNRFSRYAWLARALRPFFFFSGIGLLLIIVGTDWHCRPVEIAVGSILVFIGVTLGVRTFLNRKDLQKGLESGEIEPLSGTE